MPIIYTKTDEAPALATASLLPIIRAFANKADVEFAVSDISLSARILAAVSRWLPAENQVSDELARLRELTQHPHANIIKLPNISASVPQLKAAIAELQANGIAVPDYPDKPAHNEQRGIRAAYDVVKGSAVNPVLRQGNSDRRAPLAVKRYARNHPHEMKPWSGDCKSNVATMTTGDFAHNEKSVVIDRQQQISIQHVSPDGNATVLKQLDLTAGEIFDATLMQASALDEFLVKAIAQAKEQGILFSVHLKATMMKVSDPIIFGHVIKAFFSGVFEKCGAQLATAGANPNDGLGQIVSTVAAMPDDQREQIEAEFAEALEQGPDLAMVDSARGITCLHVPSDVIIDASMPAMVRAGGKMWNKGGELQETLAVIPDSSYSGVYQAVFEDCRANGAFDPSELGTVQNVGLMAMAAEEYGSHDKTFEIQADGKVQVLVDDGSVLIEHEVKAGDIWRGCQTKRVAVEDWVKLAVARARATGMPAVFWLDEARSHDRRLISAVESQLSGIDTDDLEISIKDPVSATKFSLERLRRGEDTIAVTGNVLRDYLTDLFPIIEVGTSAKMLSIVPLLAGGSIFETGAGGSAPKHVQQLVSEGHLRWDSLGEFLALAASFEYQAKATQNLRAAILAETLDSAVESLLEDGCSPTRRVGEVDNPESHFHLAKRWAAELAAQKQDEQLAESFAPLAENLASNEQQIVEEMRAAQGREKDLGGYYYADAAKVWAVMRPSQTLNSIIDSF